MSVFSVQFGAKPQNLCSKSVITTWDFRTYLGGIAVKSKMYPNIKAGISQIIPANNSPIKPRTPRAAGTANVKTRLNATQRHRCHQTGRRRALQCGHSPYGGLLPIGFTARSNEQLGQADQGICTVCPPWKSSTIGR